MGNGLGPIFTSEFNHRHHAGLAIASSALRILACNTKFTLWIDQEIDKPIGMSLVEVFPELVGMEEDLQQIVRGKSDALSISRIYRPPLDETENAQTLGRYFDLQIEPSLSFDYALVIIALDVTDEAHLEQQLRQERNELRLEKIVRLRMEDDLRKAKHALTARVAHQTTTLQSMNDQLQAELVERKQLEKAQKKLITNLNNRNSELEQVIYTVSHDLKSPLITIKSFLRLLEEDIEIGNADRSKQNIAQIQRTTEKMEMFVNDLLDLSRLGQLSDSMNVIPMTELSREAIMLVAGQINEHGVQVRLTPSMPTIYGNYPRLLEVMQNLIENAVKFMGDQPAPCIEIGVKQNGKEPTYYVRDNGIGIEPENLEAVFGLFKRLNDETEGTGIGLAVAKRIIELHNGRIWAASEGERQGSTFFFTLPIANGGNSNE